MLTLLKCRLLLNSQFARTQYAVFANGFHCTTSLNGYASTSIKAKQTEAYQSVADFYAGKSVFLTGGTGFLGKVFIERLLSNCSDIDKIYVLIRPKKGAPVEQRLHELLENPVFTNLKSTKPEHLQKIVAVSGDVTEPELGIRPEDEQTLKDKVSVVFHSAAAVKFTEPMKVALDANVEGTRKVMNLGQKMKNLEIFVHISTAYSNTDRLVIDEIVYPPPRKLKDAYNFAKTHSNDDEETEKFLSKQLFTNDIQTPKEGHANPYTFSKSLAEHLVLENHKNMPTIIVRPSIVSPISKAPLPGWLDTWIAGTATFSDVARGMTRILHGSNKVVIDLIPVDYVCNFAIVAAAKCPKSEELVVYNSCTSSTNPITWTGAANLFTKDSRKFGFRELPFPWVFASESMMIVSTLTFLLQTLPSFTADLWLRLTGRKPKYMKLQPRAILLRDMLKSFTSSNFLIKSDRAQQLISMLDENDRKRFICDPKTIDWTQYMPTYCYGVKQYLLTK